MKKTISILASATLLISAAVAAGPEKHVEIRVADEGDGAHAPVGVHLNSAHMDFDLDELQVGESRSVVDESGQAVLITRTDDGYEFDIGGKKIQVPEMGSSHATWVGEDSIAFAMDDDAVSAHKMVMGDAGEGILIVSPTALDESTRESIRAVLQSAGHDLDVNFIDGSEHDGERHVKVVTKRVVHKQD